MVESSLGMASSSRQLPARICIVACWTAIRRSSRLRSVMSLSTAMKLASRPDSSWIGWTSMLNQYFRPDFP